jgi:ankyrin repeat protein
MAASAKELKTRERMARLLRVATCLAECGYGAQVGQLAATARAFRGDAQVWAASCNHCGPLGRTRLMHAAKTGDIERARFLVYRGAAGDAVDKGGQTALMWACGRGHPEVVRFLVERGGANVNAATTTDGMTALMWASRQGHLEIVRFLVEYAHANVNAAWTMASLP